MEKNKEKYFQDIYELSKDMVYRLCLGYTGLEAEADDMFQEIMIKIWNNLDTFRNESNIKTWIFRIATNFALQHINKRERNNAIEYKYQEEINQTNLDESNKLEKEIRINKLFYAISQLKELDRLIISLKLEGNSYEEIANITGLSVSNVGVRISRIKKILIKKLRYYGE